jgi:hypothetical protein
VRLELGEIESLPRRGTSNLVVTVDVRILSNGEGGENDAGCDSEEV